MPPTEYLKWGLRDRGLAEGLLLYEQGQNRFGIPDRVATDPANAGFFEVDESTIDYAEAAFQEWENGPGKKEPGVQPSLIFDERAKKSAEARRARLRAERENPSEN